jgi:chemotaxis protein methyltransferase CheR
MNSSDFEYYEKMLYKESGLVITPDKSYLLDSRLSPVARKWSFDNIEAMTAKLRSPASDPNIKKDVVEAMTTNETSFFRDMKPFKNFEDIVIPHLLKTKPAGSTVRIWSAACSSGQEPYSLAMCIKENESKLNGLKFDIWATDLSDEILDTAKRAKYSQFEVQRGMPVQLLVKYFKQDGDSWYLNDDIKNMVRFAKFNLLDPFMMPVTFDLVMCRNVLIYFDQQTKTTILEKISSKIAPHSFVMLGGAETVFGLTEKLKPLAGHRGIYAPENSDYSAT